MISLNFLSSLGRGFIYTAVTISCSVAVSAEQPMGLKLPTVNNYLFTNTPQKFYMYTYRSFGGTTTKPWTAGKYGYVRILRNTSEGVLATKFHEGIDIRPIKRDSAGRPLDLIKSIAKGKVVHISASARGSNYGRYIVVEHNWGSGKFYSLYAHLDTIQSTLGQQVNAGTVIGKMGYTGVGINRERAHLHLELNVMTQRGYDHWHTHYFGSANRHGAYNGMNMSGMDVSKALIKSHSNKGLKITQFIKTIPVYFKVTIPRRGTLDVASRYPWIRKGNHSAASASWEISYSATGFPLAIAPSMRRVSKPMVSYVKPTKSNHKYHTRGIITGKGNSATLTSSGLKAVSLLTGDYPRKPKVIKPKISPEDIPKAIPVE